MPSPSMSSAAHYEALFHAASIDLVIPEISSFPPDPDEDESPKWWEDVEDAPTRSTAYFDEKLFYLIAMSLSDESLASVPGTPALDAKEPTSEMLRFLGRLQLSMTASFIPPLPPLNNKRSVPPTPTPLSASSTLAPPTPKHFPPTPRPVGTDTDGGGDSHLPPVTPNPFPATSAGEEQYAHVEGVVVWEGAVEEQSGPWEEGKERKGSGWGRRVFRRKGGWEVIWRGEVPVAYVRTPVQNPLLALTASVTLRDQTTTHTKTHRKGALSLDAMSIRSGTETIRTDGTDRDDLDFEDGEDIAGMEEIDLLGGLVGDEENMPATRLAPSLRQDLSLPSVPMPSPLPVSAITPASAPSLITPSTASTSGPSRERGQLPTTIIPSSSTTLRKSYRRVLSLAPGLRVRMRTLFLPQLLPPRNAEAANDEESEGERRVVLCVEVENSVETDLDNGFEVEKVNVEVGGKGGRATTELVCQPEGDGFPLRLGSIEQYNLLYDVSIASPTDREGNTNGVEEAVAKSLGRGDEQRPVSITVVGRPYHRDDAGFAYPTQTFHSRWNCSLDLAPFYASQSAKQAHPAKNRSSKILSAPPNAIVGDKRYSLASLVSAEKDREHAQMQARNRPLMPSQAMNAPPPGSRAVSLARPPVPTSNDHGLLLSVKLLPQARNGNTVNNGEGSGTTHVRPLEPFSIEVFVHNRTEDVRRFRLSVPSRENSGWDVKVREVLDRRRKRRTDEPDWGLEDSVLKSTLASHIASAPALIPLENDIRCGPLLPGSSLSARIRFMALREGVHRVEKLRVTGVGDDVDFLMSPVLDVVVGDGIEA
ncbi:hypothetical protein CI109_104593 [Kwoniella shandongensis]|uniref:Trafficking protein particle complex II-specific subunit 65 IgD3 domain-containing protein n=1 Tax=Kwoniella shandongensis TaxID=1734106 RepID=A0A5M6BTB3_9TREE|nr:uncharacterized protein CI109_005517 [Kwoniella shandongensis]KAA5526084.1 hypothetical protein CI109_005517 [Kwoniella shandongensis]